MSNMKLNISLRIQCPFCGREWELLYKHDGCPFCMCTVFGKQVRCEYEDNNFRCENKDSPYYRDECTNIIMKGECGLFQIPTRTTDSNKDVKE